MGLRIAKDPYDKAKEAEGTWVNLAPTSDGLDFVWWTDEEPKPFDDDRPIGRVLVARASNPRARALRDRLEGRYRGARRPDGTFRSDLAMKITMQVMSETVLLDWEDMGPEDEGEVPYSPETGARMLKENEAFFSAISSIALTNELYRAEQLKEDSESLGNTSGGGASGALSSTSSQASG